MKGLKAVLCLVVAAVVSMVMAVTVNAAEKINVRVIDTQNNTDFSYVIEAGMTLNELKEESYASALKKVIDDTTHTTYLALIDVATGREVDLDEKLTADITIKAISEADTIKITVANTGNSFTGITAGMTIKNFAKQSYASQVAGLMTDDFAMFVDAKTGEEIDLDEPLYVDTTIKAIYYITVTIDDTEHKVLETATLEDLYEFVEEKEGYEFTGLVDEEGNAVTDDDVVDKAVFKTTYKSLVSEVTPDPTPEAPNTLDNIMAYVVVGLTSTFGLLALGYSIKRKLNS